MLRPWKKANSQEAYSGRGVRFCPLFLLRGMWSLLSGNRTPSSLGKSFAILWDIIQMTSRMEEKKSWTKPTTSGALRKLLSMANATVDEIAYFMQLNIPELIRDEIR